MNCARSKKNSTPMPGIFLISHKPWPGATYPARREPKRSGNSCNDGRRSWFEPEDMRSLPRIGATQELEFVVEQKHVIDFATGGMPAVLSTPILIGQLERTARELLAPLLDPDERTVGAEIELRHFAPTPLGQRVTCTARVIAAERREVTFQIEARDP